MQRLSIRHCRPSVWTAARQPDEGAQANVRARGAHLQLELAGLDDAPTREAGEAEHVGRHLEGDPRRLARAQLDPAEGLELLDRPHHRGEEVPHVELRHRHPGARSRVAHGEPQADRAGAGVHLRRVERQVGVLERRVAEAVTERVTAAEVQCDRRAGALHLVVVVVRNGADVLRHGDGEPARGLDLAGQHVDQRGSSLLAAREGHHERGDLLLQPAQVVRAAAREHHHHRLPGRDHGLEELLLDAGQVERVGIRALAHGAGLEEARQVPDAHHGDVRRLRARHRRGDEVGPARDRGRLLERRALLDVAREDRRAVLALLDDEAALGVGDTAGAEGLLERRSGRHDLGGGLARVVQDEVHREAVAAQERQRIVGGRADQRRCAGPARDRGAGRRRSRSTTTAWRATSRASATVAGACRSMAPSST